MKGPRGIDKGESMKALGPEGIPAPSPFEGEIRAWVTFDTDFESGCIAFESPDIDGNFEGEDSDGVVVSFSVQMVHGHFAHIHLPSKHNGELS